MAKRRKGMSRKGTTRRSSGDFRVPSGLPGRKVALGQLSANQARQVRSPRVLDSAPDPSNELSEDNRKKKLNPFGVVGDARERSNK